MRIGRPAVDWVRPGNPESTVAKRKSLSKSRLMAARQCLKRLYLETHRPDLRVITPQTQAAFDSGHAVGALARTLYDDGTGELIGHDGALGAALKKTARLVRRPPRRPLFEATFSAGNVLVRVDALLPKDDGWRMVEIKASTEPKDEHYFDCAIQAWVLRRSGVALTGVVLAHVDTSFVYAGDGDYRGLLTEVDVTDTVQKLEESVPEWVARGLEVLGQPEPDVAVGAQCGKPYPCPFVDYCWPRDGYPVQSLPNLALARAGELIREGYDDLRDVRAHRQTEPQRRVQSVARAGSAELDAGVKDAVDGIGYPRYYLDFETIGPAVPRWADSRPYEVLPVQWSCHYEKAPGELEHCDFLDLTGEPPMRRLAESLIRALGREGPVLVYSHYEKGVIRRLAERYPDLAPALAAIEARLVDLLPIVKRHYYHPAMRGSWSIKAVLPTIPGQLDYKNLDEIQAGMQASSAYLEAIDPGTDEARKAVLEAELLAYCRIDTEAMVRLIHFLAAAGAGGRA